MSNAISTSRAYWQARDAGKHASSANNTPREPLGLSAFNAEAQHAFGRNVRLAMALMEDPAARRQQASRNDPDNTKSLPSDPDTIARRLRVLCQESAANLADQLELLTRFDELEGWKKSGATHCCAWMNQHLDISLSLGWEYLRVGRRLRELPITQALLRAGRLSWSVVRILCRVATADNEALLCHSALDASVSDVERLCSAYRWRDDPGNASGEDENTDPHSHDEENLHAMQQFNARAFTWRKASNGNTEFRLSLPPDLAEAFLNSIEHSLSRQEQDRQQTASHPDTAADDTMPQKRADAAVSMAEASLQSSGRDAATADRFQVLINVDGSELGSECNTNNTTPPRRPTLQDNTPIARETARRHACDCSVSTVTTASDGEPIAIGRKSRVWPAAMVRAIKARDKHCQFPGCNATRHLQIHHIQHWADGGSTCIENGVCLCTKHHTFVHEGGYRIERVSAVSGGMEKQFADQQHAPPDAPPEEIALRQSRESFDQVRVHAPDRFRFRVVPATPPKTTCDIHDTTHVP